MFDLISIGGISIDFYFKGESVTYKDNRFQLAIGGKYLAEHFYVGIGGGGVNVAVGAAKHGLKTAVMGKIGNNLFKKIIITKLIEQDISYSLCDIEKDYYNVSTILLSSSGERSIIHYMTPHQRLISDSNELKGISKTKMIYLGNLPDVSLFEKTELLYFFKKRNIKTIVNLGVKDCRRSITQLKKFLDTVDILIVNGHEFAELVKAPYKDIHFKEQVIQWYIPFLNDQLVVITEGEKGSFAYNEGKVYHQKADKVDKIVDATGAGDGYTAGFIAEYSKTGDLLKAMEKGSKYAAKILVRIGTN